MWRTVYGSNILSWEAYVLTNDQAFEWIKDQDYFCIEKDQSGLIFATVGVAQSDGSCSKYGVCYREEDRSDFTRVFGRIVAMLKEKVDSVRFPSW